MFIYIKSNTDYQYEISIGGFGFEDRATTYACDKDTYDFFEYRKQHWDSTSKQMRNFYEKYNEDSL